MSFFSNGSDITLLKNLLCPKDGREDDSDSDIDIDAAKATNSSKLGPGNLVQKKKVNKKSPYDPLPPKIEKEVKSIEEWQAMQEKEDCQILDKRKRPQYTITYRQGVGTEDVYLQVTELGNRTPASASCEDMLVEIMLPGDTTPSDKMGLNITETEIELSTNMFYLKIVLGQRVNVDLCKARYINDQEKLVICLRLVRSLDFINF